MGPRSRWDALKEGNSSISCLADFQGSLTAGEPSPALGASCQAENGLPRALPPLRHTGEAPLLLPAARPPTCSAGSWQPAAAAPAGCAAASACSSSAMAA